MAGEDNLLFAGGRKGQPFMQRRATRRPKVACCSFLCFPKTVLCSKSFPLPQAFPRAQSSDQQARGRLLIILQNNKPRAGISKQLSQLLSSDLNVGNMPLLVHPGDEELREPVGRSCFSLSFLCVSSSTSCLPAWRRVLGPTSQTTSHHNRPGLIGF